MNATVTVAVALSLMEALTLTPMRFSRMKDGRFEQSAFLRGVSSGISRLEALYGAALRYTLDHRIKVIGISIVIFSAALLFMVNISKEFVPQQDHSVIIVRMRTPAGSFAGIYR